jgi:hypothetical protein
LLSFLSVPATELPELFAVAEKHPARAQSKQTDLTILSI